MNGGRGNVITCCEDVKKYFTYWEGGLLRKKRFIKAVDGVTLDINEGKVTSLVGESGSGKTTLGLLFLGLLKPTAGRVFFEGKDLNELEDEELRVIRRKMQVIFQDPFGSLNPRMTVGEIVGEPLIIHEKVSAEEALNKAAKLIEMVGLNPEDIYKYPHEFSGGQAQRIAIARALALNPKFIVADEPVSSLDVSVRAQIINLMRDLQERLGLTYLFISHDLSVVRYISDRIAVMYLGKVIEIAERRDLYENPVHPYTKALLSAAPIPDPRVAKSRERIVLTGEIPSPINPPAGCRFHPRCPLFQGDICKEEQELIEVEPGHYVACVLARKDLTDASYKTLSYA